MDAVIEALTLDFVSAGALGLYSLFVGTTTVAFIRLLDIISGRK